MIDNKGANINVITIPHKLIYPEAVFYQWKYSFEYWLFLPPITDLYVSIEIPQKSTRQHTMLDIYPSLTNDNIRK